jgi:hypothetical protein
MYFRLYQVSSSIWLFLATHFIVPIQGREKERSAFQQYAHRLRDSTELTLHKGKKVCIHTKKIDIWLFLRPKLCFCVAIWPHSLFFKDGS